MNLFLTFYRIIIKFTARILVDCCASLALNISPAMETYIDYNKRSHKAVILQNWNKHVSVTITPGSIEY